MLQTPVLPPLLSQLDTIPEAVSMDPNSYIL